MSTHSTAVEASTAACMHEPGTTPSRQVPPASASTLTTTTPAPMPPYAHYMLCLNANDRSQYKSMGMTSHYTVFEDMFSAY